MTAVDDDGFVTAMTVTMTWNDIDAKAWEAHLKSAPAPVALQQSFAYGTAFEIHHATTHRCVIERDGQVIALCQAFQHRFFKFFPSIVIFRGPVWLVDLPYEEKENILNTLKKNLPVKRHIFVVESNISNEEGLRGYRRVMTGSSHVWLNLSQSIDTLRKSLDGKWRNALVKAEKSNLTTKKLGKKPSDYEWLVTNEWAQRKKRGYWALPDRFIGNFVNASTNSQPILTIAAMDGKEKVAGMMFLIHGNSATYHIGWSNETGRKNNAHNLLLWEAMIALKERGINYLDLGGINSEDIPGLTRFKIGTGGDITSYAGTFMPRVFG